MPTSKDQYQPKKGSIQQRRTTKAYLLNPFKTMMKQKNELKQKLNAHEQKRLSKGKKPKVSKKRVSVNESLKSGMRPKSVHMARKKMEKTTNKSKKMRIRAHIQNIESKTLPKYNINSNSYNSNNNGLYSTTMNPSKKSLYKKMATDYKFKNKKKTPKFKVKDKQNTHGVAYLEGVNSVIAPKKTVTSKSKLGK